LIIYERLLQKHFSLTEKKGLAFNSKKMMIWIWVLHVRLAAHSHSESRRVGLAATTTQSGSKIASTVYLE
jgi:hypothetical protein